MSERRERYCNFCSEREAAYVSMTAAICEVCAAAAAAHYCAQAAGDVEATADQVADVVARALPTMAIAEIRETAAAQLTLHRDRMAEAACRTVIRRLSPAPLIEGAG